MTTTADQSGRYEFQPFEGGAPTISIVMPIYNAERYLDESLGSVRKQTAKDIEIICVDDGSTDSSPAMLDRHSADDPRIVVVHQQNQGVYHARNQGLARARGEYVYFFDSDDILMPNALATAHDAMVRDELDVCLFTAKTFYESKTMERSYSQFKGRYQLTGDYRGIHTGPALFEMMLNNNDVRVVVWLQMIRRDHLVRHNIWFREMRVRMDNLFSFLVLMQAQKSECLRDALVRRRVRTGSLVTSRNHVADFEGHLTNVVGMLQYLSNAHLSPNVIAAASNWITWLFNSAKNSFREIPAKEQRLPVFDDPTEAVLASFLYSQAQENEHFFNSATGRLSRAILFFPKKVRDLLRALLSREPAD